MICKNCGATINENDARCPYCNAMNEAAAKQQFDKKLDDMTTEVEQMAVQPKEELVRHSGKLLKKIGFIIAMVILLIVVVLGLIKANEQREQKQWELEAQRQIKWENETFPQLDKWYEAKEYEKILDFIDRMYEEESENNIYGWKHYTFITIYDYYMRCKAYKEHILLEDCYYVTTGSAIYSAMTLIYEYSEENMTQYLEPSLSGRTDITEEELTYIKEYREYARDILTKDLGLSDEELEELYQKCLIDGYAQPCYDLGDRIDEKMKTDTKDK